MQDMDIQKSETILFLEWIINDPSVWDKLYVGKTRESIDSEKQIQDLDTLCAEGLYSLMLSLIFSDVGRGVERVFHQMVAKFILNRINEVGEFQATKELLDSLRQEWK